MPRLLRTTTATAEGTSNGGIKSTVCEELREAVLFVEQFHAAKKQIRAVRGLTETAIVKVALMHRRFASQKLELMPPSPPPRCARRERRRRHPPILNSSHVDGDREWNNSVTLLEKP